MRVFRLGLWAGQGEDSLSCTMFPFVLLLFYPFLGLIPMLQAEKVDMLIGSVAIGLCSSGGFCAGSRSVVDHQVPILLSLHPTSYRT